ncbi:hypothetical protein BHE74_00035764 [Ensete ventricosum]|nr:hypothetical protein BHE74_00035764 [Ensete ventricosum]
MVISSATLFMEGKAGSTAPHRALGHRPEDAKDRLFILHGKCSTVFLCELGHKSWDLAEKVNSGTNLGDLTEKVNSGINPGNLAERVNSGTNPGDLAEKVNSSTNSGDVAEKVNSGTNPRDLTEKVNSGTNPGDLTEKSVSFEQVGMTSSSSSSSVRVISSPGSGGASQGDPEANSKGVSSGPPSLVDVRVLRDLEVMKADHDLDTTVTEGSLAVIRGRYSIPAEYGLHAPRPGQRPYSSDAPDMSITVDALEVGLRFPLHPLIEDCLRWWRISPSQVAPNSWLMALGVGIIPSGWWHWEPGLPRRVSGRETRGQDYPDSGLVYGMPSNNKGWKSRYLFVSGLVWGFRLDWSAHPIGNASPYLSEEEFVLIGRLKGILSSSCAIKEMTELWLVKAGLSPASRGIIMFALFQLSRSFSNL